MGDVGTDLFSMLNTFLTKRQGPEPPASAQPPVPAGMAPNVAPKPELPAPQPGQVPAPAPTSERTLADDGGLSQFMAIQKAAQEAQRKAQLGQSLAHAGASIGAALTRSPSMRESLTTIAGQRGGAAGGSGDGVGNLSADAFLNFQKRADLVQERGRFAKTRGELSKKLGISEATLQTMYDTDPKKIAELQAQHADPTREVKVLDDGTIISTRKNAEPGEKPLVLGVDTEKVAEGKRKDIKLGIEGLQAKREELAAPGARAKVEAETNEAIARTGKTAEETLALQEKANKDEALRTRAPALAARLNLSVPEVMDLYNSGKLPDALEKSMAGSTDYQDWQRSNESAKAAGKKPMGFDDYLLRKQEMGAPTQQPGPALRMQNFEELKEKHKASEGAANAMVGINQRLDMLNSNKVLTGAIKGSETSLKVNQAMAEVMGYDTTKITNNQVLKSTVQRQVTEDARKLGTQPTDADARRLDVLFGADTTMTKEALIEINQIMMRTAIKAQLESRDMHTNAIGRYKDNPEATSILQERIKPIPDYVDKMFPSTKINGKTAVEDLVGTKGTPEFDSARADFDAAFGRGMADYVLSHKGKK